MNTKMKLKNILTVPLTISLAVLLTACTHPNNDVPIQSNGDGYDNQYYQNPPITTTDALAVGAVGVATGYALAKQANKPRYSKPNTSYSKPNNGYGKPVVVVNNHYHQTKPKVRVSRYKRK